jgi:hypothetical protein
MKIKKIEVKNFKAIAEQTADFNGCTAIVTGGNNKGKSSLLRGLKDRFQGEKPEIILKEGTTDGNNIWELTDGSKIEWIFNEKTEKINYITKDGIKMTTGVISAIGEKYFGKKFDIDKFLNSTPKAQIKELQNIVGLDFTEIDAKYKLAYDDRTYKNRVLADLRADKKTAPTKENHREISVIKEEIANIKAENQKAFELWEVENERLRSEILDKNEKIDVENAEFKTVDEHINYLNNLPKKYREMVDFSKLYNFFKVLKIKEKLIFSTTPKPEQKDYSELENELEKAQRYFATFELEEKNYKKWLEDGKKAKEEAEAADKLVKEIETQKRQMISSAKIPAEFEINENEILYNGLPLTNSQISSSGKYIAALKLGALVLGEIRTMHFDASFLDKNSLAEIQTWANENDLQLLIERPDYDGGEIKYEILQTI